MTARILGHWDGWDDSKGGVAIGRRLAEKLKVNIGDPVTLSEPRSRQPAGRRRVRARDPIRFKVIFDLGMTEFDSFYLYLPMRPAQDYLDMFDRVLKPDAAMPALDASEEDREAVYDRIYRATAIEVFIARSQRHRCRCG